MGRRVYDQKGEFVWKYVFAEQSSEQIRIAEELGIGKYRNREDENVSRSRQYGDLLMLSRKDINTLASTIKPLRRQLAVFIRAERKCFGPKGMAPMDDAKKLYTEAKAKNPDILFHLMCNAYMKRGRNFFKKNPKSRMWNCYGEI